MPQPTSDIQDLKREISLFRREATKQIKKFLSEFTPDETGVLVKLLFEDTQYAPLIDLIPVWVKTVKAVPEDQDALDERRRFRSIYEKLFSEKMMRLTGSGQMPDGSPKRPLWDAKNSRLLKLDLEEFGLENMKWFALVFFSDKSPEVKAFTIKAGYQYNVFHGMLGKLTVLDQKSINFKMCPECGTIDGHRSDCPTIVAAKKREEQERKEAMAFKEENPTIDLVGQLKQKIRERKAG